MRDLSASDHDSQARVARSKRAPSPITIPIVIDDSAAQGLPRPRFVILPFAIATLLGAFLIFQVQPIISKCVLPWFGGAPAVWTTCMLFFQLLLFGGYLYAHLLRTYLSLGRQVTVHLLLLVLAAMTLPIEPSEQWKPQGDGSPISQLLLLLSVHVGLPYFVLSSTGPLMQAWLGTRVASERIYRLYALSNLGSLVALLSYPFVVEPLMSVTHQSTLWSWMFGAFVVVQVAVMAAVLKRTSERTPSPALDTMHSQSDEAPSLQQRFGWIGYSALASTLLLTTTNHVCQDIAVIPFFWILPLSLYLISFIICFDSPKLYYPKIYAALSIGCLVVMSVSNHLPMSIRLVTEATMAVGFLFCVCLLCHGEVARQKPAISYLTQYYLSISAGGALGGITVALLCPLLLSDYSEQAFVKTVGASLAIVLVFAVERWTSRTYQWHRVKRLRLVAIVLPLVSVGASTRYSVPGLIESDRNFFGVLRVESHNGNRQLVHGTTIHGLQRAVPHQSEPTTYYGRSSGVGQAFQALGERGSIHACGVGLGCGVLASYGRAGDRFEFIEINPAVVRVATEHFSFIKDSPAKVENHLGDGRIVLERLEDRRFDIIALDAFSSDSIPAHLLTREAFQLYRQRITDDGVIMVHVSNKHLDLAPLVHHLAIDAGFASKLIVSPGSVEAQTLPALWVVVMAADNPLWSNEAFRNAAAPDAALVRSAPLWTDQRHNLLSVFRSPK
jgi:hypothetical protein